MNRFGSLMQLVMAAGPLLAVLALAGCGDTGPRIPNYRPLPQNAPANSDYQPRNSLPP